jgi:hypothetical protein
MDGMAGCMEAAGSDTQAVTDPVPPGEAMMAMLEWK